MTTMHNDAHDAYAARLAHIRATLAALQALADRSFGDAPGDLHWGHVGAVAHIDEALEAVLAFAGGTPEAGR